MNYFKGCKPLSLTKRKCEDLNMDEILIEFFYENISFSLSFGEFFGYILKLKTQNLAHDFVSGGDKLSCIVCDGYGGLGKMKLIEMIDDSLEYVLNEVGTFLVFVDAFYDRGFNKAKVGSLRGYELRGRG